MDSMHAGLMRDDGLHSEKNFCLHGEQAIAL
jgi:hypothetical protein